MVSSTGQINDYPSPSSTNGTITDGESEFDHLAQPAGNDDENPLETLLLGDHERNSANDHEQLTPEGDFPLSNRSEELFATSPSSHSFSLQHTRNSNCPLTPQRLSYCSSGGSSAHTRCRANAAISLINLQQTMAAGVDEMGHGRRKRGILESKDLIQILDDVLDLVDEDDDV